MSERKTFLSRRYAEPFNFELLTAELRQDVEKLLDFLPGHRLRVIMERLGRDRFVHVSGRSWKQVSRYLSGDKPSADVLQALSVETGTSMNWLALGTVQNEGDVNFERKLLEDIAGKTMIRLLQLRPEPEWSTLGFTLSLIDQRLEALDQFSQRLEAGQGLAAIDMSNVPTKAVVARRDATLVSSMVSLPFYHDVHASAGSGSTPPLDVHEPAVVSFDRQFLRDFGGTPEACVIIRAKGDSMFPTIPDGSLLIVDHSQRSVGHGYITVIGIGDDLLVKRVRRRLDGTVELISDNQAYPPEVIGTDRLDQLRVIGRVVYFCRVP